MKRKSINSKVKKAIALIASLSMVSCQFSGVMSVNAADANDAGLNKAVETKEELTEKPAEPDAGEKDKSAETDKDKTEKPADTEAGEKDKAAETDKDKTEKPADTEAGEKDKAAEPDKDKTEEPADTEAGEKDKAAETDKDKTEKPADTEAGKKDKSAETDKDTTEKTTGTDETEQTGKIKAEPCLSVESKVIPASEAGNRVLITVYINDKNMGSSNYYQQPDVYIDIDRRLKYIGFKNGTKDGSKGIGLTGEMFIDAKYKHVLRLYSEKGLGSNGVFAVIEVEIPEDAQPGEIYYFNICDIGDRITKVSIPETKEVAGETDKPIKTDNTSNDEYLKDTPYDGYILIDPDSVSKNPQTKQAYEIVAEDKVEYYLYEDHAEAVYCQYEADDIVIKPEINGKKVTAIADYAFAGVKLNSIEIPDTITAIGDHAFYNAQLDSIELPDSIVTIGEGAFQRTKLDSIEIPGNVKTLGDYAFDNSFLKSIILHDGIENIGDYAFRSCFSLSELKLPDTLKEISYDMCDFCSALTKIEIPSGVTVIKNGAFSNTAITTVKVPESVKEIGAFAFSGCKALENVFLSSGIEKISGCAFNNCPLLKRLTLPDTLKSLGGNVFSGTRITTLDIPVSVTEIADNAFYGSSINTINYSDDLETLPDYAYSGADKMKTVKLPSKLTAIPEFCFDQCTSLTSLDIPETVTTIGRSAFSHCGIKELNIPDTVKTIEEEAFVCAYISNVTLPDNITELPNGLFESSDIETVKLPSALKVIPEDLFCCCRSLTEITIPESVTEIKSGAFEDSTLKSIYIPASVTKIAANAFADSKLKTISGVKGSYAEKFAKDKGFEFVEKEVEKAADVVSGDTNCDGQIDLADAVMIMQAIANPDRYGIDGTEEIHLTEQGKLNGDMDGDGLTVGDALKIQKKLLGLDDTSTESEK